MTVGVTSGGGAAAFVFSKFYRSSKQIKAEDNQNEKTSRKEEEGRGETFQNCVAERLEALRQQLVVKEKELTHVKNECPEMIR
jgi:hypothetical protein